MEWPDSMEITFDVLQDCARIYKVTSPHFFEISTPLDLIGATAAATAAAVMVKDSVSVLRFDGESE